MMCGNCFLTETKAAVSACQHCGGRMGVCVCLCETCYCSAALLIIQVRESRELFYQCFILVQILLCRLQTIIEREEDFLLQLNQCFFKAVTCYCYEVHKASLFFVVSVETVQIASNLVKSSISEWYRAMYMNHSSHALSNRKLRLRACLVNACCSIILQTTYIIDMQRRHREYHTPLSRP